MSEETTQHRRDRRPPGSRLTNSLWVDYDPDHSAFPPPEGVSFKSIVDLFVAHAAEKGRATLFCYKDPADDQWLTISWAETFDQVARCANYLRHSCGVKPGDRVGILSSTRYEWCVADLAILALGAVSVPIYQTLTATEVGFVLWDADIQVVFCENEEQSNKLVKSTAAPLALPITEMSNGGDVQLTLSHIISFERLDVPTGAAKVSYLSEIVSLKTFASDRNPGDDLRFDASQLTPETLASIVYTSGTTGPPKGVMQTHAHHLASLNTIMLSGVLGAGDAVFLYLPLAHSFARMIFYVVLVGRGNIFFPKVVDKKKSKFDAKQMLVDLREAQPKLVPTVPRIFEKIMQTLSPRNPKTRKEKLIAWALRTNRTLHERIAAGGKLTMLEELQRAAADTIVGKVRTAIFGSRYAYAISGGAPISVEVIRFFESMNVVVLQGYGLTETTPIVSTNTPRYHRIGSVGRIFDGIDVVLDPDDGEILVRGGNIARSYWKRPQATAEAFIADGWFRTGDVGEIDEDGYLFITDRKKDLIVTAHGKKIAPAILEGKLKNISCISQAAVFGDNKPFLSSLVTLNRDALVSIVGRERSHKPIADLPEVRKALQIEIDELNSSLPNYEQIRKFEILDEDFSIENGLLSVTLKLKRRLIFVQYSELIELFYTDSGER